MSEESETSISSTDVLKEESKIISELVGVYPLIEVVVLGSYGRGQGDKSSDMDLWLVVDPSIIGNLPLAAEISNKEWEGRRKVSGNLDLPNLGRHRASIFTPKEEEYYLNAFLVRVGIPRTLGEHEALWSADKHHPKLLWDQENYEADLVVSLEEFIKSYHLVLQRRPDIEGRRKFLRRIIEEIHYSKTGIRLNKETLDKLLEESDEAGIIENARREIALLRENIDLLLIEKRRLLHHLAWTLEKVRWEMMEGFKNPSYFEEWRKGERHSYGFFPREIGELLIEVSLNSGISPESFDFARELIRLTRQYYNHANLPKTHQKFSEWIASSFERLSSSNEEGGDFKLTVPTWVEGRNAMTKVATGSQVRFVRTEVEALRLLYPERILRLNDSSTMIRLDMEDLGGNRVSPELLEDRLKEYVNIIKEIHAVGLPSFGRLGFPKQCETYKDYLARRVDASPIPEDLKSQIKSILESMGSELDGVQPVLCHMDAGPRNLIIDTEGKLQIVDFEHTSGCAPEWDVERILFQLPQHLRDKFEALYYQDREKRPIISVLTRLVMLSTFASKLPEDDNELRNKCFNYCREILAFLETNSFQEPPQVCLLKYEFGFNYTPSIVSMEV